MVDGICANGRENVRGTRGGHAMQPLTYCLHVSSQAALASLEGALEQALESVLSVESLASAFSPGGPYKRLLMSSKGALAAPI